MATECLGFQERATPVGESSSVLPRRRSPEKGLPRGYTHADILTVAARGPVSSGAKISGEFAHEFRPERPSNGGGSPMATVQPRVARGPASSTMMNCGKKVGEINLEDIFPKFRPTEPQKWIWIKRGEVRPLLGFPARDDEIRRFGDGARRIWKVPEKRCDHRTFAQVVMERRPPNRLDWQANKRRATEQGGGDWGARGGGDWGACGAREEEELHRQLLAQNPRANQGAQWKPQGLPGTDGERGARAPKIKCFKCGREGHHQAARPNPSLCYSCHSSVEEALSSWGGN
ncbi:hypothetical protein DAI22_04g027100 [Oryza sativa Japonica Group]|nr:uncharacterized protein LOC4335061 [Oryza sativa Japonica Group]KAF2932801.1 hypothetical protein DAI22_04g027100 [Oryza sativa Japonica Group]